MQSARFFISCAAVLAVGVAMAGCSQPSASPVLSSSSKETPAAGGPAATVETAQAQPDAEGSSDATPAAGAKTVALAVPGMI